MNGKASLYPSSTVNPACWDTAVSFDPQLPLTPHAGTRLGPATSQPLPSAVRYGENGRLTVTFKAPGAHDVTCDLCGTVTALVPDADGFWTAEIDCKHTGFCPIVFRVNGVEVLHPLAPVGYGGSSPINFLDIPSDQSHFYDLGDVPHGTVCQNYYYSAAVGLWRTCLVYLPACYGEDPARRFPVLYLQHGHGENEQCWVHQGRANFILDNLLAQNKMEACIVVMNSGMVQAAENGERVLRPMLLENVLVNDCIPYIDRTYRTKTDKWHRAMAGLSMGSMQTSVITLKHPELFAYAGIFSGFVSPLEGITNDAGYLAALDDRLAFEQAYHLFFRACGDTDFVALKKFEEDTALFAAKGLAPAACPAHVERRYHGAHEWNVWRECLRDFAQLIFRQG